jgi:hypothetical protein
MHRILAETAANLEAVGAALCLAAHQYGEEDTAAGKAFNEIRQRNGEPRPGGGAK